MYKLPAFTLHSNWTDYDSQAVDIRSYILTQLLDKLQRETNITHMAFNVLRMFCGYLQTCGCRFHRTVAPPLGSLHKGKTGSAGILGKRRESPPGSGNLDCWKPWGCRSCWGAPGSRNQVCRPVAPCSTNAQLTTLINRLLPGLGATYRSKGHDGLMQLVHVDPLSISAVGGISCRQIGVGLCRIFSRWRLRRCSSWSRGCRRFISGTFQTGRLHFFADLSHDFRAKTALVYLEEKSGVVCRFRAELVEMLTFIMAYFLMKRSSLPPNAATSPIKRHATANVDVFILLQSAIIHQVRSFIK